MKYLKLFESVEGLSHIEDLFADLKEIFDIKVTNNAQSVSIYFEINNRLSHAGTNNEGIAFRNLNKLKEYSDNLNKLQSEMKKIITLCNCRFDFQLKVDRVYIHFYPPKSPNKYKSEILQQDTSLRNNI